MSKSIFTSYWNLALVRERNTRKKEIAAELANFFFFFVMCEFIIYCESPFGMSLWNTMHGKKQIICRRVWEIGREKKTNKKKWQRKMSLHARRNVSSRRMGAKRSHGREVARGRRNSKKKHSVKECEYELSFSHQQNNFHKYFYCLLFSPFLPFKR